MYFRAVKHVSPLQVGAHRAAWSALLLLGVVAALGRFPALRALLRDRQKLAVLVATSVLISGNWLLFIWAIAAGRLLEASLGYFINPLVNVLLGVVFLGESLRRGQKLAVGLAAAGVLVMILRLGHLPWISLTLASSFGLYGLLRKRFAIDPVVGLFVETALMTPLAVAFLGWKAAGGTGELSWLLAASGIVTAVPLVLFTMGAQRLTLSTIGLMQYVAPTGQFLLAVFAFGEPFTPGHLVAFACIWASLAVYSGEALWSARNAAAY